eukprot:TRINITY_DN8933_c0_g1_i1.p1 TRINITY_DN8933_c0_g1~~TRINITY_DN8933_c0_g1_i1.p1  ORF type:complete len:329 (-),score=35.95 TRINITY_DN8933_c0_g1_i1:223-1209(-)
MEFKIKPTCKRVRVEEWGKPLIVEEIPTPEPKKGEVLIEIAASPINPADYMFTLGKYPKPGKIPGGEASGIVVKSGGSERGNSLVGKPVALFHSNGNWLEYVVVKDHEAFELHPESDLKKAACSIVNPLTVIAMIKVIRRDGHKAVVHTAGASSIGKQLIQFMHHEDIPSINIVRSQDQLEHLQQEFPYAKFLNSATPNFLEQLKKLSNELKATIAFDAIGGKFTGDIVSVMPDRSTIYLYGNLSGEPCAGINADDLIFKGKRVDGFWLMNFFRDRAFYSEVPKIVYSLPPALQSEIQKEFGLHQVNEAIKHMLAHGSKGKVILNPKL